MLSPLLYTVRPALRTWKGETMAVISFEVYSNVLKRVVSCRAVLPTDQEDGILEGPYKTIYLLHGLRGNCNDWLTSVRLKEICGSQRFAAIMPSGDNSFYVDSLIPNNDYGRFVGEELVNLTRAMFPLSRKREDTFIGGLSMGGFGALRNGLKYNDTFGYIVALSGAVHFFETPAGQPIDNLQHEELVMGDIEEARLTEKNPRVIVKNLVERIRSGEKVNLPKIYMACGTDDTLIVYNRKLRDFFIEEGLDLTYEEDAGFHDWDFWDKYFRKAVDTFLPIEKTPVKRVEETVLERRQRG